MKAYYCVGTHWDREWYEAFQEFRMWLVELIDELMDLMDREPEFRVFHLDGQSVMIEDYLKVRPEQRERLLGFLRAGRIVAGPLYVLPDEWLISGESFVRNFMVGMQKCRELGVEPLDFSYTPDQFGHIAALPMIAAGFGFRTGIVWRGTQDENYPSQFVWVGPDGSRMVTHKLTDNGAYGPFDFHARRPIEKAEFSDESYQEHFDPYFEREKGRCPAPVVLLLDAIDHQRAPKHMPRIMGELKSRHPEVEFTWGSLADYGQELLKHVGDLEERRGELREPCRSAGRSGQYLIVHTISSRYPIKRRNDQCQAALERWAEPCALFQAMAGGQPVVRYLDLAWEYLLKNHPHDSICGCSIDQVHRDMQYRFDQVDQIADGVVRRAVASMSAPAVAGENPTRIAVFNPLPHDRAGVVDVPVCFTGAWPERFVDGLTTGERICQFTLRDEAGESIPFQIRAIERDTVMPSLTENGRRKYQRGDVYHLAVDTTLPACGFGGIQVEPTKEGVRNAGTMMEDSYTVMNGVLGFAVEPDGAALLSHQGTDQIFEDLFTYEDTGDAGDGWTRGPIMNDIVFRTPGARVMTAVEDDGPLVTTFRVEREFDLPPSMDLRAYKRSGQRAMMRVVDRIRIDRGSPVVRVHTRIENTCRDHRFRVLFPTGIATDQSFAETPFAVVARDVLTPPEADRWHERVNPEKAFTTFFGIQGQEGGLAVLAPFGLHEYEVTQTPERALALTLFRATNQTVGTAGEPDGQLLGPLEFEYMLYPFEGQFDPVEAMWLVAKAQAGVRTHPVATLPEPTSFMRLDDGAAVVTAMKPAQDGAGGVIRLWNPTEADVEDRICFGVMPKSAQTCNLNEEPDDSLAIDDEGCVVVTVPAGGLTTVRFDWA